MEAKSLLEMADGGLLELVDYETSKILDNIQDPNTDYKKARELHIVLKVTTDPDRRRLNVAYEVKSPKLAPVNPITTSLHIGTDEAGQVSITELTPQIPGQIDLTGNVQPEPVKLRLLGG